MPSKQVEDEDDVPMISVTLDTNVLVPLWKEKEDASVTESLLNLADQGKIELAITSRISADITRPPWADRISELPVLNIQQIGAPFRFDHSRWDGDDVWGSDDFAIVMTSIEERLDREGRTNQPGRKDWDHLHGHYLAGRQFFLTWDGGILLLATELQEELGIFVMKPEEFLASQVEFPSDG